MVRAKTPEQKQAATDEIIKHVLKGRQMRARA
jgi:hypothetical protein